MKKWLNKNKLAMIGAVVGAIAGYFYWQQVGCSSGTCAITSKPLNSSVYGALLGALVFSLFKKEDKKDSSPEKEPS
ncbi:MAG TPA: DUF6132 family protein [Ferruginibacter sp.]|nr:DUF6132 family protein [Ferruginibacter sp.]